MPHSYKRYVPHLWEPFTIPAKPNGSRARMHQLAGPFGCFPPDQHPVTAEVRPLLELVLFLMENSLPLFKISELISDTGRVCHISPSIGSVFQGGKKVTVIFRMGWWNRVNNVTLELVTCFSIYISLLRIGGYQWRATTKAFVLLIVRCC